MKDKIIVVRCTGQEKDLWTAKAKACDISLSEWAREKLGRIVSVEEPKTPKYAPVEMPHLIVTPALGTFDPSKLTPEELAALMPRGLIGQTESEIEEETEDEN